MKRQYYINQVFLNLSHLPKLLSSQSLWSASEAPQANKAMWDSSFSLMAPFTSGVHQTIDLIYIIVTSVHIHSLNWSSACFLRFTMTSFRFIITLSRDGVISWSIRWGSVHAGHAERSCFIFTHDTNDVWRKFWLCLTTCRPFFPNTSLQVSVLKCPCGTMDSPGSTASSVPSRDSRRLGTLNSHWDLNSNNQGPLPNMEVQRSLHLIHQGTSQHLSVAMGGYKEAHPSLKLLTWAGAPPPSVRWCYMSRKPVSAGGDLTASPWPNLLYTRPF